MPTALTRELSDIGRPARFRRLMPRPHAVKEGSTMITEVSHMLDWALAYASNGWPVLPCRPGGKEPMTRHGFHDASTAEPQIRAWWERQPDANIALATGTPGPDVLDIDQHGEAGNGFTAYRRLKTASLLAGASTIVATPGGGLHLYLAGSTQPSRRLPRHHLDFRSSGGYVLAPPSQIAGKTYRLIWQQIPSAGLDWSAAVRILQPEQDRSHPSHLPGTPNASRLISWVERLEAGNRNCGLFWAACRALEAGHPDLLDDIAAAAAMTGLPEREITRTIASARRTTRSPNRTS